MALEFPVPHPFPCSREVEFGQGLHVGVSKLRRVHSVFDEVDVALQPLGGHLVAIVTEMRQGEDDFIVIALSVAPSIRWGGN